MRRLGFMGRSDRSNVGERDGRRELRPQISPQLIGLRNFNLTGGLADLGGLALQVR